MKVLLRQLEANLPELKISSISAIGDGVEVVFSAGGNMLSLVATDFEVGRRGARTAALAKFAAASGFGEAEAIYRFLVGLPQDMAGILFSAAGSTEECVGPGSPSWSDELVA